MSETANPIAPAAGNKSNDLKAEQAKPTTNDVANESKVEVNNDLKTPGRQRRKRTSEIADSSLVISTPSGTDGNRRTTRSQTRGTPAPAPTPAKKQALEKTSNGSASAKGRRGRPPKSASEEKPVNEQVTSEESAKEEEIKEEEEPESKKEVKETKEEKKIEPKTEKKEAETVDGISSSKEDKKTSEESPVKEEEKKPETKVDPVQNSQESEKPKEKVTTSPVEKAVTEAGDKPTEAETKPINNATPDTTVNNHEQA